MIFSEILLYVLLPNSDINCVLSFSEESFEESHDISISGKGVLCQVVVINSWRERCIDVIKPPLRGGGGFAQVRPPHRETDNPIELKHSPHIYVIAPPKPFSGSVSSPLWNISISARLF